MCLYRKPRMALYRNYQSINSVYSCTAFRLSIHTPPPLYVCVCVCVCVCLSLSHDYDGALLFYKVTLFFVNELCLTRVT